MNNKKFYIINFGKKLNDTVISEIEQEIQSNIEDQIMNPVIIDNRKDIPTSKQIRKMLNKVDSYFINENNVCLINTCGFPIAIWFICQEIYSRYDSFPFIIETGRILNENKFDNDFHLIRIYNLQKEHNITKEKRKKEIIQHNIKK